MVRFRSSTVIAAQFLFFTKQSMSLNEMVVGESGPTEFSHRSQENGETLEVEAKFQDSHVRLNIKEKGQLRTLIFPRDRYDYTTMDCAEMTLSKEGEQRDIRLLDLENYRLVTRTYVWRRSEDITVGGRAMQCRVIDFEDPYNHCRRWITRDEKGFLIVRQEGKGTSGSYVLRLTELRER